jgi:hypothetical protein
MAGTQHYFPQFEVFMGTKTVNLTSDTIMVGLIASGTFTWGATPEGYQYVSQFLAGDGTDGALTEVSTSGTGYTRMSLSGVSFTASGEVVTLSGASVLWTLANFTTNYGFLYDSSVGSGDSSHPIIGYWDFGGTQSPGGGPLQLTISGSGVVNWTAS